MMISSIKPAIKTPLYRQNVKPVRGRQQGHNGQLRITRPATRRRLAKAPPPRTTFEDFLLLQTQENTPITALHRQSHQPYQRRTAIPAVTLKLQA